jgi:hypothetical protein
MLSHVLEPGCKELILKPHVTAATETENMARIKLTAGRIRDFTCCVAS